MSIEIDAPKSIFDDFIAANDTAGKRVSIALGNRNFVFQVAQDYDALAQMRDRAQKFMVQIHRDKHIPAGMNASKRPEVTAAVSVLSSMHIGFDEDGALVPEKWGEKEFFDVAKKAPELFQALREFVNEFTGPSWAATDASHIEQKKSSSKPTSSKG